MEKKKIDPCLPRTRRGQPAKIDVSPDGKFLAYPAYRHIFVVSTDTLAHAKTYTGHAAATTAVRFSRDGLLLASGDERGVVKVWRVDESCDLRYTYNAKLGEIADIAWSSDGKWLAVVGAETGSSAVLINVLFGSSVADLTCHGRRVDAVAMHPSSTGENLLVMASHDFTVSAFRGKPKPYYAGLLKEHTMSVYAVMMNSDGSKFASTGADGKIIVYNSVTLEVVMSVCSAHTGSVLGLAWLPVEKVEEGEDGREIEKKEIVVSVGADGAVSAFSVPDGRKVWTTGSGSGWECQKVAIAASANSLFALSVDGHIDKWSLPLSSTEPDLRMDGHSAPITSIALSPHSNTRITGDLSGALWCENENEPEMRWRTTGGRAVRGLIVLDKILLCLRLNNELQVLCVEKGVQLIPPVSLPSEPRGIDIDRFNNSVIVACHRHLVFVSLSAEGRLPTVATRHVVSSYDASCVACTSDGSGEFAVGDSKGIVHLYNVEGGCGDLMEKPFITRGGAITALAYNRQCSQLAVADAARCLAVFSRCDWERVNEREWCDHKASLTAVAWSPDGDKLATGSVDLSLIVWKLKNEKNDTVKMAEDPVMVERAQLIKALVWRKEEEIVSAGDDGCIIEWRLSE